jgi:hypothetical protein
MKYSLKPTNLNTDKGTDKMENRIYNRRPILAKRRKTQRLNHIAKRLFQLNAVLSVALVAYVFTKYGYAYQNDIGIFIPNIGGYNFTFGA